jgi:hypothetical protein
MRAPLTFATALLLLTDGGCGGGGNCSFQLLDRWRLDERTLECCGAAVSEAAPMPYDDAQVDLAFSRAEGRVTQAHAWLTTLECGRLFEGSYPPASGIPAPLCTTYLGPVAPGEISPRRRLAPGTYRIWLQAFSSQPEPVKIGADIGIWGERCGGAGL